MDKVDIAKIESLFSHRDGAAIWRAGETPHRRAELLKPRQFWSLIREAPIFYQPLGTIEYHERCNPLGTDALKAWGVCLASADISGGIVLPPLYWGVDSAMRGDPQDRVRSGMNAVAGFRLPGTAFVIRDETFHNLLIDIADECRRAGCKLLVLLTGHNGGPQEHMIRRIEQECNQQADGEYVYATNDNELLSLENVFETIDGRHGGLYETLMAEACRPGIVDLNELPDSIDQHCCGGGFEPTNFDPSEGKKLISRASQLIAKQVTDRLKRLTDNT